MLRKQLPSRVESGPNQRATAAAEQTYVLKDGPGRIVCDAQPLVVVQEFGGLPEVPHDGAHRRRGNAKRHLDGFGGAVRVDSAAHAARRLAIKIASRGSRPLKMISYPRNRVAIECAS